MIKKISIIILFLLFGGCHRQTQNAGNNTFTVAPPQAAISHLYYSGVIKPIRQALIISPASGIVKTVSFNYGDYVKNGQLLLAIHSPEMEGEFREALSNYLRTKQAYLNGKKSMQGTEYLYKEKIISEQEYFNEQSQYQNNVLTFIEATNKVKQLLSYLPPTQKSIIQLSLSDLDSVKQLFQQQFEDLTIAANSQGIILFPEQNNSEGSKQIQVGQEVKKNDLLLAIGDLSGVAVTANVPEVDINQLQPGLKVALTFSAQPELELNGKIISVAKQAKTAENSGFSTFPVVIQADHLSPYQIQKIRVGMNAKIDVVIEEPPAIRIPIKAVLLRDNIRYVNLVAANGKPHLVEVATGKTSQDDVVIIKGLKNGDQVLMND